MNSVNVVVDQIMRCSHRAPLRTPSHPCLVVLTVTLFRPIWLMQFHSFLKKRETIIMLGTWLRNIRGLSYIEDGGFPLIFYLPLQNFLRIFLFLQSTQREFPNCSIIVIIADNQLVNSQSKTSMMRMKLASCVAGKQTIIIKRYSNASCDSLQSLFIQYNPL